MKFYLLTDNDDTLIGMRLAGIEGKRVTTKNEILSALENAVEDEQTGLILISSSTAAQITTELVEYKRKSKTLFVEIPDKDSFGPCGSITSYVRSAIGIKV